MTQNGETLCVADWAKRLGVDYFALRHQIISADGNLAVALSHVRGEARRIPRAPGERNGRARLNESTVRDVLRWHMAGESARSIARKLRVGASTILRVIHRKSWAMVPRGAL